MHLTTDPADDSDPSWSRDGATIVFTSTRFGGSEILKMNATDGSSVTRLSPGTVAYSPDWSLDGRRIAFDSVDPDGGLGYWLPRIIVVINADGSGLTWAAAGHSPAWRPLSGIGVNNRPAASFTYTCADLTCTFDGTVASDSDGTIAAYNWRLGDGTTSSSPTTTHTFVGGKAYKVSLVVMDNLGALGVGTQTVDLDRPPVASFTYACSGLTCTFDGSASYDPDGSALSYWWSFGDGATAPGQRVTAHTYASGGAYVITFRVLDSSNYPGKLSSRNETLTVGNVPPVASFTSSCNGLKCAFDGSASSDADGTIASYAWNFGDGTTGSGPTAMHAYAAAANYTITLTVTDNGGASGAQTKTLSVVNAPPVAFFTSTCSLRTCTFDGSASSDSDGTVAGYAWNFGDGVAGAAQKARHVNAAPGSYSVTLTVSDNAGGTGVQSKTVTIVNSLPTASFTSSCNGLKCTFDGSTSSDLDGTIASYAWSFGVGSTASTQTANHTYAAPGSYALTLTVTDNDGGTGAQSKTVTVVNDPPASSFTFACSNHTCTFDGSASTDSDGTIAGYAWNFGDGSAGSAQTASHVYAAPGSYSVTLTVTDNAGGTGVQSKTVSVINTPPSASFTFSCANLTCNFDGSGSSDTDGTIASYAWNFGDGTNGSGPAASHTYTASGTYTVTLTVTDNAAAAGTTAHAVTVVQPEVHVGDLDGSAEIVRNAWNARVTITVHDKNHNLIGGATVSGSWSSGETATCTTSGGQCSLSLPAIPNKTASVTFTVSAVAYAGSIYRSANNHDPDADSNGTAIVLKKP